MNKNATVADVQLWGSVACVCASHWWVVSVGFFVLAVVAYVEKIHARPSSHD